MKDQVNQSNDKWISELAVCHLKIAEKKTPTANNNNNNNSTLEINSSNQSAYSFHTDNYKSKRAIWLVHCNFTYFSKVIPCEG